MGVFFLTRDFLAQNQVTFTLRVALTSWVLWLHGLQQNSNDLVRSGVGKVHWLREEAAFWPQGKGWRSLPDRHSISKSEASRGACVPQSVAGLLRTHQRVAAATVALGQPEGLKLFWVSLVYGKKGRGV